VVINKVKEHILTEENLRELACCAINEEMDAPLIKYRDGLDVISVGITGVNNRLERLYDAPETGKIELDDLSPRIQHLRRQPEQLQVRKWELDALLADKHKELVGLEMVTLVSIKNEIKNKDT
jgi:site-specific DNA recombinase